MDIEYSNREIDRMFKEIQDTLSRIEAQTIKTNGRVNNLEMKEVPELKGFNDFVRGAIATITFAVVPMAIYILNLVL
jgi:hypothetical protein